VLQTTNPQGAAKAEVGGKSPGRKAMSVRLRPRAPTLRGAPRDRREEYIAGSAMGACMPCRRVLTTQQRSLAMSKKDEYFTAMESQIKKWDAEVDKLRVKSDQLSADARAKYDAQVKEMRANRDAAHRKLQEMRTAGESAWQNMQAGTDAAWASMKSALEKASSQFKK
jgi:hypothetical protein